MICEWEHTESGRSYYRAGPHYLGEVWRSHDGSWFWWVGDSDAAKAQTKQLAMWFVEQAAERLA